MKPYNGYEAKPIVKKETLPKGGYVAKIVNAKEMVYDWGRQLVIGFDILEGEYKGFFQKDFAQIPMRTRRGAEPSACAFRTTTEANRTTGPKTVSGTLRGQSKTAIQGITGIGMKRV